MASAELVKLWLAIRPVRRLRLAIARRKLRRALARGENPNIHQLEDEAAMNTEQILGIARHVLTTLGGGLVSAGLVSADDLNTVVGALVVVAGSVWSWYAKRKPAQ